MKLKESKEAEMDLLKLRKRKDFDIKGAEVLNAIVRRADIGVIGHFGNPVNLCLELESETWLGMFMPFYNMTDSIGYVVEAVMNAIGDESDDTVCFSSLKGRPCRVVHTVDGFVGIGAFMSDKWLLEDDVKAFLESRRRQTNANETK